MVACILGSFDLRSIGRGGKATAALAEGYRLLALADGAEAKAAVQAVIDIIEAKVRAPALTRRRCIRGTLALARHPHTRARSATLTCTMPHLSRAATLCSSRRVVRAAGADGGGRRL